MEADNKEGVNMLYIKNLNDLERAIALKSIRTIKDRPDLTEMRAGNSNLYQRKILEVLAKLRGKHE
jgi:hypothetical protein